MILAQKPNTIIVTITKNSFIALKTKKDWQKPMKKAYQERKSYNLNNTKTK